MHQETVFQREYLSRWVEPTPWEQIADYCWLLYFWKTERYDRAVCRQPQVFRYGEVMPRADEWGLCARFARLVRTEVHRLSLRLSGLLGLDRPVSKEEWYSARSIAQEIPYGELEILLARHPVGEHVAVLRH
jgi:hypothetical protein